jgi:hypothetical protein
LVNGTSLNQRALLLTQQVYWAADPIVYYFFLGTCQLRSWQGHRFLCFFASAQGAGWLSSAGNFVCSSTQAVSSWACVRPETKETNWTPKL